MNQPKPLNQSSINDPLAEELITTLKNMPNPTRLIDDMQASVAKEEEEKDKEEDRQEAQTQATISVSENKQQESTESVISEEERQSTLILQGEETLLDKYLKEENPDKKSELRIQVIDSFSKLLEILGGRLLLGDTRKKVENELTRITTTFFNEGAGVSPEPEKKGLPDSRQGRQDGEVVTIKPQEEHIISVPLPLQFTQEADKNKSFDPTIETPDQPPGDQKEPVVSPAAASIPPQPSIRLAPLPDIEIVAPPVQQTQPIITTSILEQMPNMSTPGPIGIKSKIPIPPPILSTTNMPIVHNFDPYSHESHIITVSDGSKGPGPTLLAIPQRTKGGIFSSFRSIFKK